MTSADIRLRICRAFLGQVSLLAKEQMLPDDLYREICLALMDCACTLTSLKYEEEWAVVEPRLEEGLEYRHFEQASGTWGFQLLEFIVKAFEDRAGYEEAVLGFERARDLYGDYILGCGYVE